MLGVNNSANTETTGALPAPKNKIIAALLSLCLLGGAGQLYLGQKKKGWLLMTIAAVTSCVGLDFIVLIFGAFDAYYTAEKLEAGQAVGELEWFWQKTTVTTPMAEEDQAGEGDVPINRVDGEGQGDETVGRIIITPARPDPVGNDDARVATAADEDEAGVDGLLIIPVPSGTS